MPETAARRSDSSPESDDDDDDDDDDDGGWKSQGGLPRKEGSWGNCSPWQKEVEGYPGWRAAAAAASSGRVRAGGGMVRFGSVRFGSVWSWGE